jgi:2,3-bisphosphoglycerate-dependent phosphoglycerate mutase
MSGPAPNTAPAAGVVDVVLLRHGRSTANERGIYTGWGDAPLSPTGRVQVHHAAQQLRADGVQIDVVHTSLLTRAQQSTDLLLHTWQHPDPVIHRDWRLNERHLGLLQGLTRAQVISRWGNPSRQRWRSNAAAAPPAAPPDSPEHPTNQARYRHISADLLPGAESTDELTRRVLTYWHTDIRPDIAAGRHVLIVAHRDTLRAIISHLDNHPSARFADLAIQTAHPIRYRMDPAHPCTPT